MDKPEQIIVGLTELTPGELREVLIRRPDLAERLDRYLRQVISSC